MAHGAIRIKEKLCNTPHLISPKSFDSIISYLDSRDNLVDYRADLGEETLNGTFSMNEDTGVAFIEINGALTAKSTGLEMLCGGTSYTSILESMHEAIEEGAHTVVLSVDSGGGEAYTMIQTSGELRRLADESGIKLLAYVDGVSASAAYGLSVAAHEIIVNPDAEVGSIGVVVRLINDSKALEKEGYERSFVYAGDSKIPYAADGSFRKEFIDDIQYKVDALYEQFTGYVSEMRGLPIKAVKETQASTFMADDAIKLGLVDKKMTRLEFFDYLADLTEKQVLNTGGTMLPKLFSMSTKHKESADMAQAQELQAQLESVQAMLAGKEAEFEAKVAELSADFKTQIEELQVQLSSAVQSKEQLQAALDAAEKAKTEGVVASRKAKLDAVVGTAKSAELMGVVADMDDASFEVIVKSLGVAVEAQSKTDMFVEKGVAGESEQETDPLSLMIAKKYPTK